MRFLAPLSAGLLLGNPLSAYAAPNINTCPLSDLTCWQSTDFVPYILQVFFDANYGGMGPGVRSAFIGVLLAMLIFFGFKLVFGADKDSTISEVRLAYGHAAIGTMLALAAFALADTFASNTTDIIVVENVQDVIGGIIAAFKALLLTLLIFNLFYQGFRLIISEDESQTEKAKKQFIYGMIGAVIVIIADVTVTAFTDKEIGYINTQAIGIANFLGTVLGALAVIAMIVAGIMLVVSMDEQGHEKAKKLFMGAVVSLLVVIASLSLVKILFIPAFPLL